MEHPNIVKLSGILKKDMNTQYLLMPFVGTDLGFHNFGTRDSTLTLEEIQFILYRLLGAVHYLHSENIAHRDIKPTSVLVRFTEPPSSPRPQTPRQITTVKLCSFGQCRLLSRPWGFVAEPPLSMGSNYKLNYGTSYLSSVLNMAKGKEPHVVERSPQSLGSLDQPEFDKLGDPFNNMCYWAPELSVLQETGYACSSFDWKKCDIWSLGCLLAEMLRGGEPLFTAKKASAQLEQVLKIKECRPHETLSYLDEVRFPIKANWSDKPTTSLLEQVNYLPVNATSSKKKPSLLNITTPPPNPINTNPTNTTSSSSMSNMSLNCLDLLSSLLTFEPHLRPNSAELLKHPFFGDIERKSSVEIQHVNHQLNETACDINLVQFVLKNCGGP
uniref:Protein kinase domain-containing protein n=1 Tax=Arcella intermedia TaxID=1963864 RepID=A0A6B2L6D0_9EUKA